MIPQQLVEVPHVRVHPLVAANMMCSQFRTLQQAAATAQHCEAICNDMVATVVCRSGMLCDLVVSVHRAREHADSVNAALLSVVQTLECATDELYRCICHISSRYYPCTWAQLWALASQLPRCQPLRASCCILKSWQAGTLLKASHIPPHRKPAMVALQCFCACGFCEECSKPDLLCFNNTSMHIDCVHCCFGNAHP